MITISISAYNQGQYLRDAVESVLNQEFYTGDLELIIVNDGSTDDTLEIAKKYRGEFLFNKNKGMSGQLKNFKIINQVNKGLSSARNAGLMNAIGDWFLPLDCDDILLPNCLYRIREIAEGFFPPDIISPSFKCFGMGNETVILMPNPTIEDFKTGNRIGYCSAIKREKLLEVGGYSPRMTTGYEDLHLWFDLLRRGATIKTIPEVLWLYRTKEKSMWHDALKHHKELMAQIRKDFPEVTNIINDPLPQAIA